MNIVRIIYKSLFYKVIIVIGFVMSLLLLFWHLPAFDFGITDGERDLFCGFGLLLVSVLYAIDLFYLAKKSKNNVVMYVVLLLQIIIALMI